MDKLHTANKVCGGCCAISLNTVDTESSISPNWYSGFSNWESNAGGLCHNLWGVMVYFFLFCIPLH